MPSWVVMKISFGRSQSFGYAYGHVVGIDTIGFTITIESQRWNDRNDSLVK
jgi:hypothetical protein